METTTFYERTLLDPEEEVELFTCDICQVGIYRHQEYYQMPDGMFICEDCLAEWARRNGTLQSAGEEVWE